MPAGDRVLVTGANGFIGSALVRALLDDGYRVAAFVERGSDTRNIEGLDVAVSQINRAGGIHGHKIKVIQEDDQTSASQATIGFQTLAADHVSAILGGPYNQGDEAMDPLAESSHIPLVELTSQANTVVPPKPYVYEVVPIPKDWAMPLLQYLKASGAKRIAIAYDSSYPFDIQGLNTMKANANKFVYTVAATEIYTCAPAAATCSADCVRYRPSVVSNAPPAVTARTPADPVKPDRYSHTVSDEVWKMWAP